MNIYIYTCMYREKKMGISNCHVWLLETFAYQAHKFQTKAGTPWRNGIIWIDVDGFKQTTAKLYAIAVI